MNSGPSQYLSLYIQLVKRDVLSRYRGALFGVVWVFLSPILLLAVFAFVVGHVMQARWPLQADGPPFWIMLFAGLIVFNVFAESVSRSPLAVRGFPSYVKKVIFPVGLLPLVPLGTSLIHAIFNLAVLAVAMLLLDQPPGGVLWIPLLMLPVILLALGLSWFISAWGVFIKDMSQIVPLFVQVMLFLSPVLYPVTAVPPALRPVYEINPLSPVITATRAGLQGLPIAWSDWGMALLMGTVACVLGMLFFFHSRDEFADAL